MRIYLDCCCLQRPFDDQTQPRIKVEAEAVLAILASVQAGDLSLLGSEALHYEVNRIPDEGRRSEVKAALALANEYLEITQGVPNCWRSPLKVAVSFRWILSIWPWRQLLMQIFLYLRRQTFAKMSSDV